ncbi:MAG: Fic/DOC family protein [Phycisphaerae bacterium]
MAGESKHQPSRYRVAPGIQGEYQAGSHGLVLKNKLGICTKRQIDRAEFEALVKVQEKYLWSITGATRFTAKIIRRMHYDWLVGIYPWAGQYRQVELSKKNFVWPPARLVTQNMEAFERNTLKQYTPCRPGSIDAITTAMARVQAELLLVHLFREGNGRLARWLTDLMALQAGLRPLDYGFTGSGSIRRRRAYLVAVTAGYGEDYGRLRRELAEALARADTRPLG